MRLAHCSDCGLVTAGAADNCEFCGCPYFESAAAGAGIRFLMLVFAAMSALAFSEVLLIHLIR